MFAAAAGIRKQTHLDSVRQASVRLASEIVHTVYVESSIIGYLASELARDPIVAGHQVTTRRWWAERRERFRVVTSAAVLVEIGRGDAKLAAERLASIRGLPVLDVDHNATGLASSLLREVPLPKKAEVDALHVAIAAMHGVDFLLTWNCTHLANAVLRPRIEAVCLASGHRPPTICTPEELMND